LAVELQLQYCAKLYNQSENPEAIVRTVRTVANPGLQLVRMHTQDLSAIALEVGIGPKDWESNGVGGGGRGGGREGQRSPRGGGPLMVILILFHDGWSLHVAVEDKG